MWYLSRGILSSNWRNFASNLCCTLALTLGTLVHAEIHKVQSFSEVDQKIWPKASKPAASTTLMLIDIDDTLLTGGRGKDSDARLVDHEASYYINLWRQRVNGAFLTARRESERGTTRADLAKVGMDPDDWPIPLHITNGMKKGEWLRLNSVLLEGISTIIHVDNHKEQLQSVEKEVCAEQPKLKCILLWFGHGPDGVYPERKDFPRSLEGFSSEPTEQGGTQSTFIREKAGQRFIQKLGKERPEQFKEEVLADALYAVIGKNVLDFDIHVPPFQLRRDNDELSRITPFLAGNELGLGASEDAKKRVARGFVVDAFLANWDVVVGGRNLWLHDNLVYRLDNGGSLRYRALGKSKSSIGYDFADARCDLYTLRGLACAQNMGLVASRDGATFYGSLSEDNIREQIARLVPLQDEILSTADAYHRWLRIENYPDLRADLVARLDSLKSYYHEQVSPVTNYTLAHGFRRVLPEKSSASILITADHGGKHLVLLGKRRGHDWWGNLGGKADRSDKTLLATALREVSEESMGFYEFQTADLVAAASHDLLKGGDKPDALHRMYVIEREYIPAVTLRAKLAEQRDEHAAEYSDFIWVEVQALRHVVEENFARDNQLANEKQYQLAVEGRTIALHHPLMDMLRQAPVLAWLKALEANRQVRKLHTQGSRGIAEQSAPEEYARPAFWDPLDEERAQIYYMTTTHLNLLTEFKLGGVRLAPVEKRDEKAAPAASDPTAELDGRAAPAASGPASPLDEKSVPAALSATDAYLRFKLRDKFVRGDNQGNIFKFLETISPLANPAIKTEGDENIWPAARAYFQEFDPIHAACESSASNFRCSILEAVKHEQEMPEWFVFYHSLPGKMAFIYDVATALRNLMRLQGSESMHSLRALDTFFKDLATVDDYLEKDMERQHKRDFKDFSNYAGISQEVSLSTNLYLFGNPRVDTNCTFDLYHNDRTQQRPDYERFLLNTLSHFGITDTKKYFALYDEYFPDLSTAQAPAHSEGRVQAASSKNQLLQIFINPEEVDKIVYLAGSMGSGLYSTFEEQKEKLAPSSFLKLLRDDAAAAESKLEGTELDRDKVLGAKFLDRLQARIFMKPSLMTDPDKVIILRYYKSEPKEGYLEALAEMIRGDISQWLEQRYSLPADTLENPSTAGATAALPPLQKLHRLLQQGKGLKYKTKPPKEHFAQFLRKDQVEGVRQILAEDPHFDFFAPIADVDYSKSNAAHSGLVSPISLMQEGILSDLAKIKPQAFVERLAAIADGTEVKIDERKDRSAIEERLKLLWGLAGNSAYIEAAYRSAKADNFIPVINDSFNSRFQKLEEKLSILSLLIKFTQHGYLINEAVGWAKFYFEQAIRSVDRSNDELARAAKNLFTTLFTHSEGFNEAAEVAQHAMTTSRENIQRVGIELAIDLLRYNQAKLLVPILESGIRGFFLTEPHKDLCYTTLMNLHRSSLKPGDDHTPAINFADKVISRMQGQFAVPIFLKLVELGSNINIVIDRLGESSYWYDSDKKESKSQLAKILVELVKKGHANSLFKKAMRQFDYARGKIWFDIVARERVDLVITFFKSIFTGIYPDRDLIKMGIDPIEWSLEYLRISDLDGDLNQVKIKITAQLLYPKDNESIVGPKNRKLLLKNLFIESLNLPENNSPRWRGGDLLAMILEELYSDPTTWNPEDLSAQLKALLAEDIGKKHSDEIREIFQRKGIKIEP